MALNHGRDAEGRKQATATDGTAESTALARFLTEEVQWADYADLLIARATEAAAGRATDSASGNGCAVDFAPGQVTITHLHLRRRPALRIAADRFLDALTAWRDFLRQGR